MILLNPGIPGFFETEETWNLYLIEKVLGISGFPFSAHFHIYIYSIFGLLRDYRQTGLIQNRTQKRALLEYEKVIDCPIFIKVEWVIFGLSPSSQEFK